jgi:hypothetical protein
LSAIAVGGFAGRDEPSERDFATAWERARTKAGGKTVTRNQNSRRQSDMASALLRRQLAHKIALPRRCRLFSSASSVLAQAAPQQSQSTTTTTPTPGGKNVYNRHIAEELQGISASEILAESGTRKDAQMRHFTGEEIWWFFFGPLD